jgi:hypothetical protein
MLAKRQKALEEVEEAEEKPKPPSSGNRRQSAGEAFFKSLVRSIGSHIGRSISRGILGTLGKR